MAAIHSWRWLLRPSMPPLFHSLGTSRSSVLPFSTTATLANMKPPKKKGQPKTGGGAPVKKSAKKLGKRLKLKKRAIIKSSRPPAPGERKAVRKRVILSNTNALEVKGVADISHDTLLDTGYVGTVMGLPGSVVDQLRAVDAFKKTQGWDLFRRPCVLIRKESVDISRMLDSAQRERRTTITIVDGEKGSGKSMLLLHALTTAFMKDWIVVNIPEAQELTTAGTEYAPIPSTTPQAYSQNNYTANLLSQIFKANQQLLSKLMVSTTHTLPFPIPPNMTLARLADLGSREIDTAWPIFLALWTELTLPGRPPILLALDGLAHIMRKSAYRAPDFSLIHAHDLALVSHFTTYLSGSRPLTNGGSIVAATTTGNSPVSYAMNLAIRQQLERQTGKEVSKIDPFKDFDERAYESMKAAGVVWLEGLSKEESRALMEYWAASGMLRDRVDERSVVERWALAGNGIVGELERAALRMRI